MRNPLLKRLKKELFGDIVKYIIMLLFLALPIALCSGYMIGNDSMLKTYDEAIDKYVLEDGHFQTVNELTIDEKEYIEKENNLTLYDLSYKDEIHNKDTVRIYKMSDRKSINMYCLHKGTMPEKANEIALDRLYCSNNKININDKYMISDIEYTVTAFISIFDYSTLFKSNSDSMFNATTFTISLVTDDGYNNFSDGNLNINYAYLYPQRLDSKAANEKTKELTKNLYTYLGAANIVDFVAKENNQAINFTRSDISGDLNMMLIFGIFIVFGLAFVFALSTKSQIEKEAKSIGTLKALGFKNTEILSQYLILPTITTFIAAIIGNILAYTVLKDYLVGLYYSSYSLPVYTTYYNFNALLFTTILPLLLVFVINLLIIARALNVSCLNLLRGRVNNKKHKKVMKLSHKIAFIPRYQLRVVTQNKGTYIALFFGTLLASVILLFGLMMDPLLQHYKKEVEASQIAPYQTILKADVSVSNTDAEKVYLTTLTYGNDDIMIYGLVDYGSSSKYLSNLNINDKTKVVINSSLSNKYKLKVGKSLTASNTYTSEDYTFNIEGIYQNDGNLIIFMTSDQFLEQFSEYNISYFSNTKLDVDDYYVYKTITLEDLQTISNQLADSMGKVFYLFTIISCVLFTLLIFLLAKIVIEKSQKQISMLKIIGYKTTDINKIYNVATGIVTIVSLAISTLLSQFVIKLAWDVVLRNKMKGWLNFYIAPYLYPLILGIGLLCYLVTYLIESYKISRISLAEALKEDIA